jgi:pimeloyl-ACP methyl ester carboxylesterase
MHARRVDLPWGHVRVWEEGGGAVPVLAIHGLGGSGRYWAGFATALGGGFRVVAPDLGGFGGSTKPRPPADRNLHLASLDAVAATVGSTRLVVVGHSLGGVLGLLWTAANARSVDGLAIAASPYPTPTPAWDPARWRGRRGYPIRTIVRGAKIAWPLASIPVQTFGPYPPSVVRDYGRQSLRSRIWTLWSLWGEPGLEDEVRAAATIVDDRNPVSLVYAEDDRSVPPANGDRWADLLPRADRVTVPAGGHQFLLRGGFGPVATWIRGVVVGHG